ncbi:MAG: DUF2927 domain-containing protein [Pseudomonadota bacterium]
MMRCLLLALVLVLLSGAPTRTVASSEHAAGALADGFYRTVFGLEYGAHPDAFRVKRFANRVRFHISDQSGHGRLAEARRFIASLPHRIRHFDSVEVTARQAANFRVTIVRRADFARAVARELKADAVAMNARCLVGVSTRNGRILSATAIIVGDDDRLFARCLVEEVLQGLGPMNDDRALVHSVFNDSSEHVSFTSFDVGILNLLYHPSVRPGMSARDVKRVLPRALSALGYQR